MYSTIETREGPLGTTIFPEIYISVPSILRTTPVGAVLSGYRTEDIRRASAMMRKDSVVEVPFVVDLITPPLEAQRLIANEKPPWRNWGNILCNDEEFQAAEAIVVVVGQGRESRRREFLDALAYAGKRVGIIYAHGGSENGEWTMYNEQNGDAFCKTRDLVSALDRGRTYGAIVAYVCNRGDHSLRTRFTPLFYGSGLIGPDADFKRKQSIPGVKQLE